MLKKILDALSAIFNDVPVFSRLLDQLKQWGESQQAARKRLISTLSNVVQSFERSHAIVLIELSRLTTARSPENYRQLFEKLDYSKLYELFKSNEVCEHVHQLQADLESGFGEIKDAIVLGAAQRLKRSLGEFESYEYSLAQRYVDYLRRALLSPHRVTSDSELQEAIAASVDEEQALTEELRSLTDFKRKILSLSLYG